MSLELIQELKKWLRMERMLVRSAGHGRCVAIGEEDLTAILFSLRSMRRLLMEHAYRPTMDSLFNELVRLTPTERTAIGERITNAMIMRVKEAIEEEAEADAEDEEEDEEGSASNAEAAGSDAAE